MNVYTLIISSRVLTSGVVVPVGMHTEPLRRLEHDVVNEVWAWNGLVRRPCPL